MKYLVRSVKYFIYFSIICAVIVSGLVLIGIAEGDINSIFQNGYEDVAKIALIFVLIAAIYPKVGFITRGCRLGSGIQDLKPGIVKVFSEKSYILEKDGDHILTFRKKGMMSRISRMYEDRITLTEENGTIRAEGLRKDIIRLVMGLEYRLGPSDRNE